MSLVLLKRFAMLMEAELAANTLRASGIQCVLQKDGVPGSAGVLIQGAEVYVDSKDIERASGVIMGSGLYL